jgi:hypothetical protein
MAKMSTRKKIKLEALRCIYDLENATQRLKTIDEMADGGSKVITQMLPSLVQMLDMVHVQFTDFHSRL